MPLSIKEKSAIEAGERLLVDVQADIFWLMHEKGVSQADLARELGVSKARVSQLFGDKAENLTIRTLAKIFDALGERASVHSPLLVKLKADEQKEWPVEARRNDGVFADLMNYVWEVEQETSAWANDNEKVEKQSAARSDTARAYKDRVNSDAGRPVAVFA
mgnify:CR=1 FL=1